MENAYLVETGTVGKKKGKKERRGACITFEPRY